MKYLPILAVIFAACARTYTIPVIGMPEDDFKSFCSPEGRTVVFTKSTVTGNDITHIYELQNSDFSERCDATYTFVNGKLTEVSR